MGEEIINCNCLLPVSFCGIVGFGLIKIDKTQRHQYSMSDVGRWIFDVPRTFSR
jgi:hypothetical protein